MFRMIRWFSLAIGLLAVLAAPVSLRAQAGTGSISGNVSDHHGAPLGGAKVTLVSEDTKVSTGASTDGTGHYRFEGLKPGYYDLTFEATGLISKQHRVRVKAGKKEDVSERLKAPPEPEPKS